MSAVAEKFDDIQAGLEKTGAAFTTEKMLAVRGVTRAAIHEIASRCKPNVATLSAAHKKVQDKPVCCALIGAAAGGDVTIP